MKQQQEKFKKKQELIQQEQSESESSAYSSQDQNAYLLTQKVEEKILQTVARLKSRDPSIYTISQNIFEDEDFQAMQDENQQKASNKQTKDNKKFTYKDMLSKGIKQQEASSQQSNDQQLAPALAEKKAKNKFKQAIDKQKYKKTKEDQVDDENDLFVVKGKVKKDTLKSYNQQQPVDKYEQLTKKMKPSTKKLIKTVWEDPNKMDQTDLFLKDYILSKKWLKPKTNADGSLINPQQQVIDEQDEQRSIQMDEYQAKYNFRYQQPDGDKIIQYPRKIQQTLRLQPQSRKDKRKKLQFRKKQQQKQFRQQAQKKKQQLRENILQKLQQQQGQQDQNQDDQEGFQNDWFFCDDCGKAFQEDQQNYQCMQCQDYMLCADCYEIIIHKHPLNITTVPEGHGAPKKTITQKILAQLQPCKTCRRKLPKTVNHYEYKDRSGNTATMCQKCYDQSALDVKKKFILVEAKINQHNIEQLLDKDPEKIKQLTNSKQIQQMVDQYLKYQFEDVIGGGLKTKFKYINVKPQSYGLSDEQILFGDDKQLNNYVSVKNFAPYSDRTIRLRNNIYRTKVKTIDRTVNRNKQLIQTQQGQKRIKKSRAIQKIRHRSTVMKKKRQQKLRILNLSNPARQKQIFVPTSRLASYGLTLQKKQQANTNKQTNKFKTNK